MYTYQVETKLSFSEDNTCEYTSSWYADIGSFIFKATNCNYELGEGANIKKIIDGTLQLYNNLGDI